MMPCGDKMGDVKIAYYVTRGGGKPGARRMAYWAPCLARPDPKTAKRDPVTGEPDYKTCEWKPTLMARLGFQHQELGEDGPLAWAAAQDWNKKWLDARAAYFAGTPAEAIAKNKKNKRSETTERVYPRNSVGEAFAKFRGTATWELKKPGTRADWMRGWEFIAPVFGDVDPRTLDLVQLDRWYGGKPKDPTQQGLLQLIGVREAHRAMKIWRALWKVISTIKRADGQTYCVKDADPSLGIRRKTPKARTEIWFEGEVVRLVKRSIRMGYIGAACALAVAWDTMLSPIDVVSLTKKKLAADDQGPLFDVDRTKTGAPAVVTISRRTWRLFGAYLNWLQRNGVKLEDETPFFFTRGSAHFWASRAGEPIEGRPQVPRPYTRDKLGKDFRKICAAEFPGDTRKVMDIRRSGAVEARAGAVAMRFDLKSLAGAMANTIDASGALRGTYLPPDATATRLTNDARAAGRRRLRLVAGGRK
jgi:hypothetical protein